MRTISYEPSNSRPEGFPSDLPFVPGVRCFVWGEDQSTGCFWTNSTGPVGGLLPNTDPASVAVPLQAEPQSPVELGDAQEMMRQAELEFNQSLGKLYSPSSFAAGVASQVYIAVRRQLEMHGWEIVERLGIPEQNMQVFERDAATRIVTRVASGDEWAVGLVETTG